MNEQQVRQIIREELGALIKSDRISFYKLLEILDGRNIQLGRTTGTKLGTATDQKLSFFGSTPLTQQAITDLTNNMTSGGSANTLTNFTDLVTYAADSTTIRNNFYQLGQKVKEIIDTLQTIGLIG